MEDLTLNLENNLNIEPKISYNINDIENFVKKEEFIQISDITYLSKENIERIWYIIKNFEIISKLINLSQNPCIIKKGLNNFDVGDVFEGILCSLYVFYAKVLKVKNFPERKKIEIIFLLENGEIFKSKINLYKVTKDDSCVLNYVSKYIPKFGKDILLQIKSKNKEKELFKKIDNILEKQAINLYQYESGIIQGKMEDIWSILKDNSKLIEISPDNKCFLPININNVKVGEIVNVDINIKGNIETLEIKLDLKEEKKCLNKWIYEYTILNSKPFKIPKQSVFVQLTKINNAKAQLSLFTKIHEPINKELFKKLSQKKQSVIYSLKQYFNNFYSCKDK